jgi:PAS domain S-box-containing protein
LRAALTFDADTPALLSSLQVWGLYVLAALLSLTMADQNTHVCPLYLGAGVAVAAVLGRGRRVAPAVAAGAATLVVLDTLWLMPRPLPWVALLEMAAATALGAALQALFGAWLVECFVSRPPALEQPRDIAKFYLCVGPLASVVNATLATAAMLALHLIPTNLGLTSAISWWSGDTLGAVAGAPIALTVLGQPASLWRARRRSVGLPLLAAALLLGLTITGVQNWRVDASSALHLPLSFFGIGLTWLLSACGVVIAGSLGAMLLVLTARTHRVEEAVEERTSQLEREIRQHRETEKALRESEERFRAIYDHVPIGVVYADLEGRIRESNPAYSTLTDFTAGELRGASLTSLVHPEDRGLQQTMMERVLNGQARVQAQQLRYLTRDAQLRHVKIHLRVLHDSFKRARGLVAVVEDETHERRLRQAETAREAAESANRAKSEFLSRMSHELRTPLNAMLGFSQLMSMDGNIDQLPQFRDWAQQIQHAGWHLSEMINDVLDLSRIEAGTLRLHIEPLSAHDTLAHVLHLLRPIADQLAVELINASDGQPDMLFLGDATRVQQVLSNLVSNAVKYNRKGGHVIVGARADAPSDELIFEVRDNGLGMSAAQMEQLFQPFNRLGRERSSTEGTGIGLVLSRRLAEMMGGGIEASSVEGQGSTFTLALPLSPRQDLAVSRGEWQAAAPNDAGYRRRRVYYIEDNPVNAEVMRGIFAQRPQVEFEVYETGRSGLDALRGRLPDLLLLDKHLPDLQGLEILNIVKSEPELARLPVVMVSADALAAHVDEAIEQGAMAYLSKPVNVPELLALVDEVLGEATTVYD